MCWGDLSDCINLVSALQVHVSLSQLQINPDSLVGLGRENIQLPALALLPVVGDITLMKDSLYSEVHARSHSLLLLHLQLDPQTIQTKNWHMDVIEMNGVRRECDCMLHPTVLAPDTSPGMC